MSFAENEKALKSNTNQIRTSNSTYKSIRARKQTNVPTYSHSLIRDISMVFQEYFCRYTFVCVGVCVCVWV